MSGWGSVMSGWGSALVVFAFGKEVQPSYERMNYLYTKDYRQDKGGMNEDHEAWMTQTKHCTVCSVWVFMYKNKSKECRDHVSLITAESVKPRRPRVTVTAHLSRDNLVSHWGLRLYVHDSYPLSHAYFLHCLQHRLYFTKEDKQSETWIWKKGN